MATEAPSEMRERVRSYIQHNATKASDATLELVEKGHRQLMGLVEGLSEEQATFKPGPDEWSVLDTFQHVVAAKTGTARVCGALARGERPGGIGGEGETRRQDGITGKTYASLAEAAAAAQAAHEELVAFLKELFDDANIETMFEHFLFGELNCREWAVFQRVHDGDHAGQIEKIKAAEEFPPG